MVKLVGPLQRFAPLRNTGACLIVEEKRPTTPRMRVWNNWPTVTVICRHEFIINQGLYVIIYLIMDQIFNQFFLVLFFNGNPVENMKLLFQNWMLIIKSPGLDALFSLYIIARPLKRKFMLMGNNGQMSFVSK